ncbi:multidrug efflux RND transporter permease subunit [Limnobacter sp.]|uniref:multidrug efflux RND transporter permease subunit n=1 Tax=Limnobacter sp. TaxID=2003368 RepID=UPI00258D7952|nr:multidrug efflux RND transporter permease subunit [Limnobacter sp.]
MNFSEVFIRRPVGTSLITLAIILVGAVAFRLLPVSPLPQVDFPVIAVSAQLPGASPETMASAVATPLERSLGRIAGINEMTSTSSLGSTTVILQFDLNRDINGAARDVQAAINAARTQLPTGMKGNPTYRKYNPADAPIMIIAMSSDTLPPGAIYDAASTVVAQKLSQVEGVGQVTIGGSAAPAVRVELNTDALNKYGIPLAQVASTIQSANGHKPKGLLDDGTHSWQIGANDQLHKADDFLPLVIHYQNGSPLRLSDVAKVSDSVEDVRNLGLSNGKRAIILLVRRQPGANIIETNERIKAALPQLVASIDPLIHTQIVNDRTSTIRASVHDVEFTLMLSIALVIMVVFVFLRNAMATLIPAVALPVSLAGTFGVMYLFGFSLDNLSLMALTVATGFVVDDAIVVLENIARHIENGESPMQATLKGTREVIFTVVAMSLSLVAVFLPILLMGGIVGRLLQEFAIVLSASVLVSLVISLTVTPMMCARMLKHQADHEPGKLSKAVESGFLTLRNGYQRSLDFMLNHSLLTMGLLVATVCLNVYLYIIVPKGFFPQQDTGRIIGSLQADEGISFQALEQKLYKFVAILKKDPAVENVVAYIGGGRHNGGFLYLVLKPQSERKVSADEVINRLRPKLSHEPGAAIYLFPAQDIRVGGRSSNAQYQYTLQDDDLKELQTWAPKIRDALKNLPNLADVSDDREDGANQTYVRIDRDKAARAGVNVRLIDGVLGGSFGQKQVSTIYESLNQYYLIMEADAKLQESPASLNSVYLVTDDGRSVPLTSIATIEDSIGPTSISHQGQFVATTISFNLKPGVSLSQATADIDTAFAELGVPSSLRGSFQGTAKAFQSSVNNQPLLILAALVTIYIVLGMLYESLIHPITILSTLTSAGVGALLALMAFGHELNIMALIGVLLLIGIVKKNAIMMIDFAIDAERSRGLSPQQAIYEACLMRFRPIMMTTLAALLGALPLALGLGEGYELRQPLGISIVGGLIVSQLLTLYTTPVVYLYLDRLSGWFKRKRGNPIAHKEVTT